MDLPDLIERYVTGSLVNESTDQNTLCDYRQKVAFYHQRLAAIVPSTDHITNLLSLLLDMQDEISQHLNPNQTNPSL